MAYFIMPKIGEPVTCKEPCNHRDCMATRRLATTPCDICGKLVEAGTAYVFTKENGPRHFHCQLTWPGVLVPG